MKFSLKEFTRFEKILWITSIAVVAGSFILSKSFNVVSLLASLLGVSGVILCAKGNVIGQFLIIIFALLYAFVSFEERYYGEMITYLGMSAPVAVVSIVTWIRNPYTETEVKVGRLTAKKLVFLIISAAAVTTIFFFILKFLGTNNLIFSTISVTTSYLAATLTAMRVEYYALAYAANDIVLIVLWVLSSIDDIGYATMIICFSMFLINDIYGFYNWKKLKVKQSIKDNSQFTMRNS